MEPAAAARTKPPGIAELLKTPVLTEPGNASQGDESEPSWRHMLNVPTSEAEPCALLRFPDGSMRGAA